MMADTNNSQYFVIGADQSMFTQKVRAYMRNNSIPFQDVASDIKLLKTLVMPNAPYPLIPNLMVVDKDTKKLRIIQDSKIIMQYVQQTHGLGTVKGTKRVFADMLLEMVLDDFLFVHVVNWRWGHPSQDKYLEYTFGDGSLQYEASKKFGKKILAVIKGPIARLGLTEKTTTAFRDQLTAFFELLTVHLETYQFLLGNELTAADYSLYGHLAAGLLRDPAPYEWLASNYPVVQAYAQRVGGTSIRWGSKDLVTVRVEGDKLISCEKTIGKNHGGRNVEKHDEVPETTTKFSALLLRDYLTILVPTVKATLEFLGKDGKDEVLIPRALKPEYSVEFTIHGKDDAPFSERRMVSTHCVWMLQRILDSAYRREQRAEVDKWLSEFGCLGEWKETVAMWEGSGWRVDMTKKGTLAKRKVDSPKL
ncbi:hypothetical protein TWF225_003223 [Orbilia oligospora]|nr:hypothetical protein TWF225_003223 [Orbilia oligospora]KAF3263009.1 hypothetical protein TWF128_001987 [Orbilia oligospora]KAF3267383.1 hypothetical protein TWF217_000449 [Orbilia oligospora]